MELEDDDALLVEFLIVSSVFLVFVVIFLRMCVNWFRGVGLSLRRLVWRLHRIVAASTVVSPLETQARYEDGVIAAEVRSSPTSEVITESCRQDKFASGNSVANPSDDFYFSHAEINELWTEFYKGLGEESYHNLECYSPK
ncbi:hypothetical protein KC19_2G073500 [Ceratodon purpureus]|uniref:Uncharacterized protein n=1 Tax=Ceratodon purpureus TaxID=3225 RepID=A0A8T0IR69_CERPU|nr:hypothetical protein KC19_2G073500 [Ceratodon purpureus]